MEVYLSLIFRFRLNLRYNTAASHDGAIPHASSDRLAWAQKAVNQSNFGGNKPGPESVSKRISMGCRYEKPVDPDSD